MRYISKLGIDNQKQSQEKMLQIKFSVLLILMSGYQKNTEISKTGKWTIFLSLE